MTNDGFVRGDYDDTPIVGQSFIFVFLTFILMSTKSQRDDGILPDKSLLRAIIPLNIVNVNIR